MQHWNLSAPGVPSTALVGCIAGVGSPAFADAALASLNGAGLAAGSWSVYRTWRDRAPCLHLSAAAGVADSTRECFRAYAEGLYRADRSFDAVRPGTQGLLRMHADEVPNADHREAIYRRHRVIERLSVVDRATDGSLFAVNLYRHEHQGRFADGDVAGVAAQAPLLLALVRRHVELTAPAPARAPRERLLAQCPALTERELDVCERLLRGWTHDGIAADLGLSLATVKTYRARAFARLGLHFRSELFARFGAPH
jgi:DNA-binding CsgD family transcriptional regulator